MFISAETLDDALLKLYPALLARSHEAMTIKASRGETAEVIGALIEIRNPRARLSRSETRGKLYSSLGELLWYLSKDNRLDFIAPYVPRYSDESEDGVTIYGGYGPRLFGPNGEGQVKRVIGLLTERPTSRRAVIQIFDKEDIANNHKEVPCTTTLQCFVRDEKLDMVVTMRSNDAYFGLPHDVFCFTMLQEIIARSLCRDVGCYRHFAGSMHIYKERWDDAQHFVDEGYPRTSLAHLAHLNEVGSSYRYRFFGSPIRTSGRAAPVSRAAGTTYLSNAVSGSGTRIRRACAGSMGLRCVWERSG